VRVWLRGAAEAIALAVVLALVLWLALLRWLPVSVGGGSMRPALVPGDLVLVARAASVSAGDIVLLESERHGRVLHRVVARRGDGTVRTRGDANAVDDLDATPATAVVGPVVLVAPFGRAVDRWRAALSCVTIAAQRNSSKR
jgi:signal peptidase I